MRQFKTLNSFLVKYKIIQKIFQKQLGNANKKAEQLQRSEKELEDELQTLMSDNEKLMQEKEKATEKYLKFKLEIEDLISERQVEN